MKLPEKGKNRELELQEFANELIVINEKTGFKVSSRGWCYQLEGLGIITKGEFPRVQKLINECRKKGYLPIDFVAEEEARSFSNVYYPDDDTPNEILKSWIRSTLEASNYYKVDYWEGEKYYIQMLVEKVDLVSLFEPICKKYYIPIATSKGWSSILQRAEIANRFRKMEETGHTPVLLYCGDHDPFGLAISDFLMKNFRDIERGTGWSPHKLIVDRFGLNYDFIIKNNLSWIDNLETGSGKRADTSNPIVQHYISLYGERKVEANAIVVNPEAGRELCEESILKYLGNIRDRYKKKEEKIQTEFEELKNRTGINDALQRALDLL